MNPIKSLITLLLALTLTAVWAQDDSSATGDEVPPTGAPAWSGLPAAAQEALEEGTAAMQEALDTYSAHYPDRSLWQEAFRHGRRAQSLAPQHPAPQRFLAEAYSRANWYGPAWNAWLEYLGQGHLLDAEATPLFSEIGSQLGYTFYEQGDLERAAEVYTQMIDVVPFDLQAHAWMGRILVESGRPEQAISYWQTVVNRDPDDQRAEYFLELAREQANWGTGAVNAFREGVAFYEEGNLERARERFARATAQNQEYAEAWAWLGRVAFESAEYADARTYYERASELRPTNETYSYFFEESGRRLEPTAQETAGEGEVEQNAGGGAGSPADAAGENGSEENGSPAASGSTGSPGEADTAESDDEDSTGD